MACCSGSGQLTEDELNEKKRNAALETETKEHQKADSAIKKLLLLGAGESGKSTLFKQAIAIYGKPLSKEEIMAYVPTIHNNIVQNIKTLIKYCGELSPPCPVTGANTKYKAVVDELKLDATRINAAHAEAIAALWKDSGVQAAYERRAEYQLNDSTEYFFQRVNDVVQPNYSPSQQDILRSRVRTTGIVETTFLVEGNTFKMYDVGGQRNERKKWIHCFENVTAVLFVAAISEYDQKLFEDETQNRMVETVSLFEEIVNSRWFRETSTILFLNKRDLFANKITKVPITVCPEFADYQGPNQYGPCAEYIQEKFEQCLDTATSPNKQIYTHITCATDSENMKVVFHAVQDIVIRDSLRKNGLL